MEFLLNRYRNLTVLLVVIGAQLLLLAYQVKGNQDVRLVRVWAVTAVTPLARVLEIVRRNTIGIAEDYFDLINVRDDNNHMKKELGRLKMENQFLKTELQTADRAKALRAFQSRTQSRTLAARIIGNGTGMNSKDVLIDRGSSSGVMRGMAVVTPDGIVGRVLASYPTASQVLLITDPTFAAGAISEKNRVHGTLKGIGQSKCIIDYVQNEEKVDVGEVFYTSGDDRVFPKGLPIGTATVVRSGKTFKEIYIVPSGTQNGLEEVLVVIEGVHQAIPDSQAVASNEIYVLPEPPAGKSAGAPASDMPGANLSTDADRLRERYKKIGAAQNHVFGEGLPGARPPNFNLNPDAVVPGQPGKAAGSPTPGGVAATPGSGQASPSMGSPASGQPARPVTPGQTNPVKPAPATPGTIPGQPQSAGVASPGVVRPNSSASGQPQSPVATSPAAAKPPQSAVAPPPKTTVGQPAGSPATSSPAPKPQLPKAPAVNTTGESTQIKAQQPPGTVIVVTPKPVTPKPVKPVQANPPQEAPPNL